MRVTAAEMGVVEIVDGKAIPILVAKSTGTFHVTK